MPDSMADRARSAAVNCEAKKTAYRQTKEGVVVSFVVHPNDVPDSLALAQLGTRYMLALVELADDETPVSHPVPALGGDTFPPPNAAGAPPSAEGPGHRKSEAARERYIQMDDGERAVARASIMAKDARFHAWVSKRGSCQDPTQFIRDWCQVKSRTEIASNMQAFERFLDLEHEVRGFAEQRG